MNAEKKRNMVFEEQVGAWKKRFMQITGSRDGDKKKEVERARESLNMYVQKERKRRIRCNRKRNDDGNI